MTSSLAPKAESNDSFFFVSVQPNTAKRKGPCRDTKSRSHVMRYVRRRDKGDVKWSKSQANSYISPSIPDARTRSDKGASAYETKADPNDSLSSSVPTLISQSPSEHSSSPGYTQLLSSSSIEANSPSRDLAFRHFFHRENAPRKNRQSNVINLLCTGDDDDLRYASITNNHSEDFLMGALPPCPLSFEDKVAARDTDPFRIVNISPTERPWQAMLHWYKTNLYNCAYVLTSQDVQCDEIFRIALHDEMVLSAIAMTTETAKYLRFASSDVSAIKPANELIPLERAAVRESKKHKSKMITLLNQRMGDVVGCSSDAVLVAVYKVIIMEIFLGNFEEAKIHQGGLSRIVQLRGGLDMLPVSLSQGIMFAESLLPFQKPVIPRPPVFELIADRPLRSICDQHTVDVPVQEINREVSSFSFCSSGLLEIFDGIRDLIEYADIFGIKPQHEPNLIKIAQTYQLKYFIVKHRLAAYEPLSRVESVFATAMSAFLNVTFIWGNPGCAPIRLLVEAIDKGLTPQIFSFLWENDPEVLLWIGAVTSFCTLEQAEHSRFLDVVRGSAGRLGLKSWYDCRRHLKNILFYKGRLDPHFEKIWHIAVKT